MKYVIPKLSHLGLKVTILQVFKVEHFTHQNRPGEWVDITLVSIFCLHDQSFLLGRTVYVRNMSSDSEMSSLPERSSNLEEEESGKNDFWHPNDVRGCCRMVF